MTIQKRVLIVAGAALLIGGGVFAWFLWDLVQVKVTHRDLKNEQCAMCHRPEREFYRGHVKTSLVETESTVEADVVTCTECHDLTRRQSRQAVAEKCLECHKAPYVAFLTEWTTGVDEEVALIAKKLRRAESVLADARREQALVPKAERLVKEAREALGLVRSARGVHNPDAADALSAAARQKAREALAIAARR